MPDALPEPPEPGPAPEPSPPPAPTCSGCQAVLRPEAHYCSRCGRPTREGVPDRRRTVPLSVILSRVASSARPGKQTILFYFLWCLTAVISAFILRGGAPVVPVELGMEIFDSALTVVWVLALRRDILPLYGPSKGGWKPYGVAVGVAYPLALGVHSLVRFLESRFSIPVTNLLEPFRQGGYGWGLIFLSICIQPAVIEELAFRGVILTTLRDVMRPAETIVVAAIAFSIMHFSLVMFVPFVLMGLYLGWLRHWSGSLWPAMMAHFLHNTLVTVHETRPIFPF